MQRSSREIVDLLRLNRCAISVTDLPFVGEKYLFLLKWCRMCVVAHRFSTFYRLNTIIAERFMCYFNLII